MHDWCENSARLGFHCGVSSVRINLEALTTSIEGEIVTV